MKQEYWMKAEEIATEMGVSKGHAYKLIRELNAELKQSGFVVVAGRIPRPYWEKRFYGYQETTHYS